MRDIDFKCNENFTSFWKVLGYDVKSPNDLCQNKGYPVEFDTRLWKEVYRKGDIAIHNHIVRMKKRKHGDSY